MQRENMQGDIKEIWAMLEKTRFTINVAADEALQEGHKCRQDVGDELCAGRMHHLKKHSSGINFKSVGELWERQRGHVSFLRERKCSHVAPPRWSMNFIPKATDSMCTYQFFCSLSLFWQRQLEGIFSWHYSLSKIKRILWKTPCIISDIEMQQLGLIKKIYWYMIKLLQSVMLRDLRTVLARTYLMCVNTAWSCFFINMKVPPLSPGSIK